MGIDVSDRVHIRHDRGCVRDRGHDDVNDHVGCCDHDAHDHSNWNPTLRRRPHLQFLLNVYEYSIRILRMP